MRKGIAVFLCLVVMFSLPAGCGEKTPEYELDTEFLLPIGEEALIKGENILIEFIEVTEDNRRPRNVKFGRSGQAGYTLLVTKNEISESLKIYQIGFDKQVKYYLQDYKILSTLEPYPEEPDTIEPRDYRIRISVNKVPKIFADSALEELMRFKIGKFVGNIEPSDLDSITSFSSRTEKNRNLTGVTEKIENLTGLEYCTNLTNLDLSHNDISDISPLANLNNLKELNLGSNNITDISTLAGLSNLTTLHLDGNQIDDISGLTGMSNLITLYLNRNQIDEISGLAGMSNLTTLYLTNNQIEDTSALIGLSNLTTLCLSNNRIEDISSLAGLTKLTTLYLVNNQIVDISSLKTAEKLEELIVYKNKIEDITPLEPLQQLQKLYAQINNIQDISPLLSLTNLQSVVLDWNPLNKNSLNMIIPELNGQGVYARCWPSGEEEEILRLLLEEPRRHYIEEQRAELGEDSKKFNRRMEEIEGVYDIIAPIMGLRDFIDTEFIISSFEHLGYDLSGLAERLIELNKEPAYLNIESSQEYGYIIDYDSKYTSYFYDLDDGWYKLRKENPLAGTIDQLSIPAYDPDTGLVIVMRGWQADWTAGGGNLILYKYENGRLIELYRDEIWVS
jgi:Leucine-rich repeat (LRR) protein